MADQLWYDRTSIVETERVRAYDRAQRAIAAGIVDDWFTPVAPLPGGRYSMMSEAQRETILRVDRELVESGTWAPDHARNVMTTTAIMATEVVVRRSTLLEVAALCRRMVADEPPLRGDRTLTERGGRMCALGNLAEDLERMARGGLD